MIEAVIAGLFGLLLGSFLNVCIYRLPLDLSVVKPRSFCPHCERTISWYDNVPVASYLLLRGRCRNCGARIPLRYPAVELMTGAMFGVIVAMFGLTALAAKLMVFSAILITLVFTDLEERILPDEFTKGGIVAGIVFAWFVPFEGAITYLLLPFDWGQRWLSVCEAAIAAALISFLMWGMGWLYIRIRRREGLGLGDVKMIAMLGAFLGLHLTLMTLIVGSLLGTLVGFSFIKLAGKDAESYQLPFGSFLGLAAIIVGVFGDIFGRWYSGLFQ